MKINCRLSLYAEVMLQNVKVSSKLLSFDGIVSQTHDFAAIDLLFFLSSVFLVTTMKLNAFVIYQISSVCLSHL